MTTREAELTYLYLIFDLAILNFALIVVAFLETQFGNISNQNISIYIFHTNISWIVTYFIFSKKNLDLRDGFLNRFIRITKRMAIFFGTLGISGFLFLPKYYSRLFLIDFSILFYIGTLIFYYFLYKYLKFYRKKGKYVNRAVIIGNGTTAQYLQEILVNNYLLGYQFIGFLCSKSIGDKEVIGDCNDLHSVIEKEKVQMVFATQSMITIEGKGQELLEICNRKGVRLRFVPENQRWYRSRFNMESVGNLVVINPQENPLDNLAARASKRLFDLLFSTLVILLVFSWFFPIMALLIKLSSKGPVFFVQKRTGMDNHSFGCIKFRSMKVNGDADSKQASANDSRITKIGRFMRKTNIDELPQFINVLLGQMSVVGPRPHMLKHTEQYSKLIEYYLTRHHVKPGITGWAQVNGYRGETDELWKMEKRVEFDKEYIDNWTFIWDLKIIWMTIFGGNSYTNAM